MERPLLRRRIRVTGASEGAISSTRSVRRSAHNPLCGTPALPAGAPSFPWHQRRLRQVTATALAAAIADPQAEAVEIEVDHRRRIEREQLAQDQPADDGDAERAAQFAAIAETDRERQGAEQRRTGGH